MSRRQKLQTKYSQIRQNDMQDLAALTIKLLNMVNNTTCLKVYQYHNLIVTFILKSIII